MPDGRGARIAVEAGFLLAVAVVLGVARVEPVWVVMVMTVAWVIVALLEWAAWREEPHWASGQPPRYYVPPQPVPPRPPTQELPPFSMYPRPAIPRDDAPTWIATPELREELLGWPAGVPVEDDRVPLAAEPARDELLVEAAVVAYEPEENGWEGGWPAVGEPAAPDPWLVESLPEVAVARPEQPDPEPEPEPEPVRAPEPELDPAPALDPEPEPTTEAAAVSLPAPDPAPALQAVAPDPALAPRSHRLARHRLDPFPEAEGRRRPWQRRSAELPADAELPSLPHHAQILARSGPGDAR